MEVVIWRRPVSKERVAGLTLSLRAERAAAKAGASRVRSVDRLEECRDLVGGFLLIFGDSIFEPEALEALAGEAGLVPDRLLAVETGRSCRAGGLYYCPPDFWTLWKGDWEAVLRDYRSMGRTREVPAEEKSLFRVSSRSDVKAAERQLKLTLYRSLRRPSENWVLRNLNRPVSRWISYLLVRTPLTPNQISLLTIPLTCVAAWFLAHGDPLSVAVGGILFQVRSILDCSDGEVARLKLAWSRRGQWIDTVSDNTSALIFLVGVVMGASRQGHPFVPFLAGATLWGTALTLALMLFYLVRYTQSGSLLTVDADFTRDLKKHESSRIVRFLLRSKCVMKKDYYSLIFFGICLLGRLDWVLILSAIASNIGWMALLAFKKEFFRAALRTETD